jgi:hypothetical protein
MLLHPIENSIGIVGLVVFSIAFCWSVRATVDFLERFARRHKAGKLTSDQSRITDQRRFPLPIKIFLAKSSRRASIL